MLFEQRVQMVVTPLLFRCAKTVSELHLFAPLRLLLERKPIPQIVVNVRTSRKTTEPLEATSVPWAQGVGRSNRPAPTNRINQIRPPKVRSQSFVQMKLRMLDSSKTSRYSALRQSVRLREGHPASKQEVSSTH
jgi:hypothetical protein